MRFFPKNRDLSGVSTVHVKAFHRSRRIDVFTQLEMHYVNVITARLRRVSPSAVIYGWAIIGIPCTETSQLLGASTLMRMVNNINEFM